MSYYTLLIVFAVVGGLYFYKSVDKSQDKVSHLDKPAADLTIEESIKKRAKNLEAKKAFERQNILQSKELKKGDAKRLKSRPVGAGVDFPDDPDLKELARQLSSDPFENSFYEDPENEIRRKIVETAEREEQLRLKAEKERQEFLEVFIQNAKKKGYNVEFTEDGKVELIPIEKD